MLSAGHFLPLQLSLNQSTIALQVIVAPLVRLGINKPGTPIQDINTPSGLLQAIGPYITGTELEEDDVVSAGSKVRPLGRHHASYPTCMLCAQLCCSLEVIGIYIPA